MTRRVVVTGTGVITPVGNDIQTYWENLVGGVCGIDFITSFPTEELPVKVAGQIKEFTPADYEIETPFAFWSICRFGHRRIHYPGARDREDSE